MFLKCLVCLHIIWRCTQSPHDTAVVMRKMPKCIRAASHHALHAGSFFLIASLAAAKIIRCSAGWLISFTLTAIRNGLLRNLFRYQRQLVNSSVDQDMSRHFVLSPEQSMLGCLTSPFAQKDNPLFSHWFEVLQLYFVCFFNICCLVLWQNLYSIYIFFTTMMVR